VGPRDAEAGRPRRRRRRRVRRRRVVDLRPQRRRRPGADVLEAREEAKQGRPGRQGAPARGHRPVRVPRRDGRVRRPRARPLGERRGAVLRRGPRGDPRGRLRVPRELQRLRLHGGPHADARVGLRRVPRGLVPLPAARRHDGPLRRRLRADAPPVLRAECAPRLPRRRAGHLRGDVDRAVAARLRGAAIWLPGDGLRRRGPAVVLPAGRRRLRDGVAPLRRRRADGGADLRPVGQAHAPPVVQAHGPPGLSRPRPAPPPTPARSTRPTLHELV
ncbi:expressed protein, partial [Aureococcus anophagefferens]